MANAKLGGKASYLSGAYLEKLDSDRTLTLGDSGRIFLIANGPGKNRKEDKDNKNALSHGA